MAFSTGGLLFATAATRQRARLLVRGAGRIASRNPRGPAGAIRAPFCLHVSSFCRNQLLISFADVMLSLLVRRSSIVFDFLLDFLSFWKVSLLSLGAAAWPRSLIVIFLRSRARSISRAWHFAILLSTALACSLGCGPSCVFAEGFEACFFFSRKNDEDLFLADFLKNWRRHGMAARLHNKLSGLFPSFFLLVVACAYSDVLGFFSKP